MKRNPKAFTAGKHSAFTLIEIMIVVLIIGILLAIAVPNFIRAREQSRGKACSANLKQIEGAKEQWALDQKKNSSDTPLPADLYGPGLYIKATPGCPSAGSYNLGPIGTTPVCNKNNTMYPHTFNAQY